MAPADPDPETVKSVKLAGLQLNAVRISLTGNGPRLPDKEQIAPNQLSWPPTAACMGVKRGEKCKVDSALMAEHIGIPKRKRPNDDPYGAGEDSGKHAKPDAVSAAANARARAAEEWKAFAKAEAAECLPHLHHSRCICPPIPPIPPIPWPTRCLIQCTCLRCICRHTSLSLNPPIHSLHICSITLVHSQLLRPIHPCFRLTHFPLPLR